MPVAVGSMGSQHANRQLIEAGGFAVLLGAWHFGHCLFVGFCKIKTGHVGCDRSVVPRANVGTGHGVVGTAADTRRHLSLRFFRAVRAIDWREPPEQQDG